MNYNTGVPRRGYVPILEVVGLVLLVVAILLLVTQLSAFGEDREQLPDGLVMAQVPVGGLTRDEAKAYVERVYGAPVSIYYQDEEIRLNPSQVSFQVEAELMLSQAEQLRSDGTFWAGFWDFLWRRPEQAFEIDLIATFSQAQLGAWVSDIAARYNSPPSEASTRLETMSMSGGQSGFVIDEQTAVTAIGDVLMQPTNRSVALTVNEASALPPNMDALLDLLVRYLESEKFEGVASVYLIAEETGEELQFNVDMRGDSTTFVECEIAYAGLSTMKIPLTIEYFRWLYDVLPYEYDVVDATLTQSSNLNANFMLRDIGGGSIRSGTQIVNQSWQYLGLENTFMVSGYDEEDPPEYYSTPARQAAESGSCIYTAPDPYMQTTVTDLTLAMDMVYQCAEFSGGGLVAAYPNDITQEECQLMLDTMTRNVEGQLIRAGLPENVPVAHKHGFSLSPGDTVSDTAVIYSPGGDYVLTLVIFQEVDWVAPIAHRMMEGLSTAIFNYFNPDMVNVPRRGVGDVLTPVDPDTGLVSP